MKWPWVRRSRLESVKRRLDSVKQDRANLRQEVNATKKNLTKIRKLLETANDENIDVGSAVELLQRMVVGEMFVFAPVLKLDSTIEYLEETLEEGREEKRIREIAREECTDE